MGHDITAFDRDGKRVAYLSRSMGNPKNRVIYELLDAEEYHAGCSGCGAAVRYTKEQFEAAHNQAQNIAPEAVFSDTSEATQLAGHIAQLLGVDPRNIVMQEQSPSSDISPEIQFLKDAIQYNAIEVTFA